MNSLVEPAAVLLVRYAAYHRDRRNILTHFVGIPMIITAIGVGLAFPLPLWDGSDLTGAWLLWAVTSLWYLGRQHVWLGFATVLMNGVLIALAHILADVSPSWGLQAWQTGAILFVVGWVVQFVGHWYEGRKPAFVDDIVGLLVGPMFVVAEWLMLLGLLDEMRQTIEAEVGPVR